MKKTPVAPQAPESLCCLELSEIENHFALDIEAAIKTKWDTAVCFIFEKLSKNVYEEGIAETKHFLVREKINEIKEDKLYSSNLTDDDDFEKEKASIEPANSYQAYIDKGKPYLDEIENEYDLDENQLLQIMNSYEPDTSQQEFSQSKKQKKKVDDSFLKMSQEQQLAFFDKENLKDEFERHIFEYGCEFLGGGYELSYWIFDDLLKNNKLLLFLLDNLHEYDLKLKIEFTVEITKNFKKDIVLIIRDEFNDFFAEHPLGYYFDIPIKKPKSNKQPFWFTDMGQGVKYTIEQDI
ncbi:MAG: hypothetical protein LBT85_02305 [Bifidobacteriaceae bacterium]|jgi:hypothetical protein|nr:hypothetical protein [Bifidobacteriaceae bacterium]